jgi:hypothetical protein
MGQLDCTCTDPTLQELIGKLGEAHALLGVEAGLNRVLSHHRPHARVLANLAKKLQKPRGVAAKYDEFDFAESFLNQLFFHFRERALV